MTSGEKKNCLFLVSPQRCVSVSFLHFVLSFAFSAKTTNLNDSKKTSMRAFQFK